VDALKGVLIVLVLLSHTRVFALNATVGASTAAEAVASIARFIDLWVLPLAVPTFLVASLWIYAERRDGSLRHLVRRLKRLGLLYIFWTAVQFCVAFVLNGSAEGFSARDLLTGGPAIPIVGGSVVYFLSNLILLTCIVEGLYRLGPTLRTCLCIAILTATVAGFAWLTVLGYYVPFWYPLSFIPAAPIVVLLHGHAARLRRLWPAAATAWWVVGMAEMARSAAVADAVSPYARVSLWAGATGLMGAIGLATHPPNPQLMRLGANTMGVFVLNLYVAAVFYAILPTWEIELWGLAYNLTALPVFLLTAAVSIGLTVALKKTPLKAVL
jgi:fucose 4-O-acetylase-like acetyltransferase